MRSRVGPLLFALLCAGGLSAQTEPSLSDLEKNLAQARQMLRANPDSQMGWSQLLMMETMILQVKAQASGEAPEVTRRKNEAMRERVLQEWRTLRPRSAGPELFRIYSMEDRAQQETAVLGLLGRYPDDPMLLERVGQILRRQGETARYGELLDGFARREPDNPEAFRLLGQYAAQIENWAIAENAYKRWGELRPTDAQFVQTWLYSPLARRDPQATAAILDRFFAGEPRDAGAFNLCSQVAGQADSPSRAAAVACLGRFAGGREASLAEQAVSRLAELAAAEGRVGDALAPLRLLAPEARGRALVGMARALAVKENCDDALPLVEAAVPLLKVDPNSTGGWASPAGVLAACASRPDAVRMYLRLVERAPDAELQGVISAWSTQVKRQWITEWMGPLPAPQVAAILEKRLAKAPSEALYRALLQTYRHGEMTDRLLPHLERWEHDLPGQFWGDPATLYAERLLAAGRAGEAEAMLRRRLTAGWSGEIVERLAALVAARGDLAGLEAISKDLEGRGDEFAKGLARLMRARTALLRGDADGAQALYREVVALPSPPRDAAQELLALTASRQPASALQPLAQELCALRGVSEQYKNPQECSARLLAGVGRSGGAVRVLAEAADRLPEDVSALRALAQEARGARRFDAARQALKKAVDLDAKSAELWGELVELEAEHFPLSDVERSIDAARRQLPALPWQVQTARAKAYRRAGEARQAIAVLHEARALADNEYTLSWTHHWLREAYAEFGRELSEESPPSELRPPAPNTPGVEKRAPADLLALAEAWNTGTAQPLAPGGATFDGREAWALFERAARSMDPEVSLLAKGRLVILLERGRRGVPRDRTRAVALWRDIAKPLAERAAAGDPRAAYLVATVRLGRIGGPPDLPAAKALLERAASAPPFVGQSWVFHNLGWLSEFGAPSPNLRTAREHYRRAAEAGNVVSRYDLGRMLLASGPLADCQEALRHLEVSAAAGYSVASAYLGKSLLYGGGSCLEPNAAAALPHLERANRAQEDGAAYDLGFGLLSGADPRRGVEILAAAPGTLPSDALAFAYATGMAVPRDIAAARRWRAEAARRGSDQWNSLLSAEGPKPLVFFREGMAQLQKLAAAGDPVAQAHLAEFLSQGLFVDADPARAVELARAAAEKGVPEGMRLLADALRDGSDVVKDVAAWHDWTRRCAEAGDSFCARALGHALIHGELVPADRPAGLRWLERAGRAGNAWALLDLGRFYDEGIDSREGGNGVPRDPARAREWMRLAAANGTDEARGWLAWNDSN